MTRRVEELELMKIIFIIDLSAFSSNVLLTLKVIDFENVVLTLMHQTRYCLGMLGNFQLIFPCPIII
jgi:hypothetical protein